MLIPILIVSTVLLICKVQSKFEFQWTPRYLKECELVMDSSFIFIDTEPALIKPASKPKKTRAHLLIAIFRLTLNNQWLRDVMDWFNLDIISSMEWFLKKIIMSSANPRRLTSGLMKFWIWEIYKLNNKGDKMQPWGRPLLVVASLKGILLRPCETQISIFFKSTFKRLFGKRRTSSALYT